MGWSTIEPFSGVGTVRTRAGVGVAAAFLLGISVLTGCGDDESAQDRYCAAGESFETSLNALLSLDLIAEGTDGLEAAVDRVQDDLEELRDTASEAVADEVDALEQSVEDLESSISELSGDLSGENAAAVGDAIGNVSGAAGAVLGTLADC